MAKFSYGVSAIEHGDINAGTGLGENFVDVGDVYKDTASMGEEDGEVTKHFAERKTDPVVTIQEPGTEMVEFSLMDTSADNLVIWCGGTVDDTGATDVWAKPTGIVDIEKSLKLVTEDGCTITINRAKIKGKRTYNPTKKGAMLIEVKAEIMAPLVDGVPAVTITDPA